jgi:hypothetical protein
VLGGSNDQQPITTLEPFGEESAHIENEQPIIVSVELHHMLFRLKLIEQFGAGGHLTSVVVGHWGHGGTFAS